jgi:hypothetical protein
MREIENAAELSVGRGVGFAGLGIAVAVAGLSFDVLMALRTAASLTLLVAAILALKASRAESTSYRRTEVWLLLDPRPALSPDQAQRLVGSALRATLERYAGRTFIVAVVMWAVSVIINLAL